MSRSTHGLRVQRGGGLRGRLLLFWKGMHECAAGTIDHYQDMLKKHTYPPLEAEWRQLTRIRKGIHCVHLRVARPSPLTNHTRQRRAKGVLHAIANRNLLPCAATTAGLGDAGGDTVRK